MKYVNDDLEISCNESERNFFRLIWWKKINSNEEDKKKSEFSVNAIFEGTGFMIVD